MPPLGGKLAAEEPACLLCPSLRVRSRDLDHGRWFHNELCAPVCMRECLCEARGHVGMPLSTQTLHGN